MWPTLKPKVVFFSISVYYCYLNEIVNIIANQVDRWQNIYYKPQVYSKFMSYFVIKNNLKWASMWVLILVNTCIKQLLIATYESFMYYITFGIVLYYKAHVEKFKFSVKKT